MCEQNSQNRRCTHNIHSIFGVLSERLGAICFWCRSCCCWQSGANCIHCYSFICFLVCIPFSDVFFCSRRLTAIAIETIKNNKKIILDAFRFDSHACRMAMKINCALYFLLFDSNVCFLNDSFHATHTKSVSISTVFFIVYK